MDCQKTLLSILVVLGDFVLLLVLASINIEE